MVIDIDASRLAALSDRYDVRTVEGDGTTSGVLRKAGVEDADLFIGCSPREEANLVCAMLVKRLSGAQTIVRTTSKAYLDAWRERELDVDFMVSPELETANAISAIIGIRPRARPTCSPRARCRSSSSTCRRAPPRRARSAARCGSAEMPADSKVAGDHPRRRDDRPARRRADPARRPRHRDRLAGFGAGVGARDAAQGASAVDDVVIFGAGRMGTTIAGVLLERGIRVRLVDAAARARARRRQGAARRRASSTPSAFDPEFLEHERIGRATAAVFCLNDDAPQPLRRGARQAPRRAPDDRAGARRGLGRGLRERRRRRQRSTRARSTAEEMVRFAHDPRIRQIAMLERRPLRGARPHRARRVRARRQAVQGSARDGLGDRRRDPQRRRRCSRTGPTSLHAGDRVIMFVESRRASLVEKAL